VKLLKERKAELLLRFALSEAPSHGEELELDAIDRALRLLEDEYGD